ncbi:hypothetical protein EDD11_006392 [Mortierella claussenii]|nr:hypothetical protein EDD11_006392 [Mortierella claussenii]
MAAQGLGLKKTSEKVSAEIARKQETKEAGQDDDDDKGSDSTESSTGGDDEDEDEEVDESQILTLLRPLVSDMYSFRIIPMGVLSEGAGADVGGTGDTSLTALSAGKPRTLSATAMALSTVMPTFPVKPKRCTRLPCYPVRQNTTSSTSNTASSDDSDETKVDYRNDRIDNASASTSNSNNSTSLVPASTTFTKDALDTPSRAATFSSKNPSTQGIVAKSISCISMPCSPLLGCRVICPDLGAPPLLTLYTAAASAVSSSVAALLPSSVSTFAKSSTTLTTTSSLQDSPEGSPFMLSASSSTSSLVSGRTAKMQGLSDEMCGKSDEGCSLTIASYQKEEEEEENEEGDEEEEVLPLMDQSIYAAGAITGSKFVRYVLGNGVAIVEDILRSEAIAAC